MNKVTQAAFHDELEKIARGFPAGGGLTGGVAERAIKKLYRGGVRVQRPAGPFAKRLKLQVLPKNDPARQLASGIERRHAQPSVS